MDHEPSFPVTLLFLFELLQSHVIKNRCYDCVCVCKCTCVCVQERVCVFAQVPKKSSSVYNMCLCWESEREWLSTWEQCGTTVSLIVYNHSLKQSVDHADCRNTAVCEGSCFLTGRGLKTQWCICFVWHMDCFLCPLFQSPTTKHDTFTLRDWHQLKQKTSVSLVQVNHFAQAAKL